MAVEGTIMRSVQSSCVAVGVIVAVLGIRVSEGLLAEEQPSRGQSAAILPDKNGPGAASGFSLMDPTPQRPREGWLIDVSQNDADKRKKLLSSLHVATSLQCNDLPLRDALRQVLAPSHVRIKFDQKAIDDDGTVSLDDPITHATENEMVEAILFDLLEPRGLTWIPRGDSVVITTWTEADARLETMAYDVTELVVCPKTGKANMSMLIPALYETVNPDSWNEVGGAGSVVPMARSKSAVLIVRQTFSTHRKVGNFLSGLRQSGLVSELTATTPSITLIPLAPTTPKPGGTFCGNGKGGESFGTGSANKEPPK